jgi:hypothetical protein
MGLLAGPCALGGTADEQRGPGALHACCNCCIILCPICLTSLAIDMDHASDPILQCAARHVIALYSCKLLADLCYYLGVLLRCAKQITATAAHSMPGMSSG